MTKHIGRLLIFIFLVSSPLFAEDPWSLKKDADGIKVWSRPVPGAGYSEFKGIGDVKAPLEVVNKVYEDIPSYPQWYGFCKETKVLRHDTPDTWQVYIVIKTPGPVKDRDVIANVSRVKKPDRIDITLTSVKEDLYPNNGKYVRMTEMTGTITMTKAGEDTTNVVCSMKPNPAGYIPGWISNVIQKDQPFLTIKGLREMVNKDTYYEQAGIHRKK
jgi:hypothetical protein